MPIAPYNPARNPLNRFCAVATGITMSALTSSNPSVRIAVVTVIAASTTISRLYMRTRNPSTRAKSDRGQQHDRAQHRDDDQVRGGDARQRPEQVVGQGAGPLTRGTLSNYL